MKNNISRLKLTLLLLTLVLIGGTLGFWAIEDGWSLLDSIYMTVITVTTVGFGEVQPLSQGGRLFAMAVIVCGIGVAGLAASKFAAFVVSQELNGTLRKRRIVRLVGKLQGHSVVCGYGSDSQVFCKSLRAMNRPFVVVADNQGECELALSNGYLAIAEGGELAQTFNLSGVSRAANVVVMEESDRDAVAAVLEVVEYIQATPHSSAARPSLFVRLQEPALCDLFKASGLDSVWDVAVSLSPFSAEMNMVRLIYQGYPLEMLNEAKTLGSEVHIVLPALDDFGSAFAVYSGLIGHYRGGIKTHIHVVGQSADRQVRRFLRQSPGFAKCGYIQACEIEDDAAFVDGVSSILETLLANASFSVFLPEGDELVSFKLAVTLAERMQFHAGARILVRPVADSPITRQITTSLCADRIRLLPHSEEACGVESVLLESLDEQAKSIHSEWCAEEDERAKQCESKGKAYQHKPAHKPWHELTEEQKNANRLQADHIAIKIRAAGLSGTQAKTYEAWSSLPTKHIEILAEMEHERWCAEKYMSGWQYAATRDDSRKLHNNLIPYADLDDPTKQYDRDTIMKLYRYLAKEGA